MTASLECDGLTKIYPGQSEYALGGPENGVSFTVNKGELFALLGPSGCGKTTTLRIVGGFVPPNAGRVAIEGRDVTNQAPYHRPTNTVFQSYALFPHMSLGGNVEFGLAMEGVRRRERRQRVAEALDLVGLGGQEKRRVTELSGGQAQRAALARAIVKRPAVLLLDEPLGALDLRLRKKMQQEIVHLKLATGTTFLHVTHDQEEACAIADRIAVMRGGEIVQIDTPLALYQAPRSTYVADFINAGTIVRGVSRRSVNEVEISTRDIIVRGRALRSFESTRLAAVIPRDSVVIAPAGATGSERRETNVPGTVERIAFTGSVYDVTLRVSETLEVSGAIKPERMTTFEAPLAVGAIAEVSWSPDDVIIVEDDD